MGIRAERVFDVFGACERWWMGWDGMCGYWVSRGLERGDVDRGRESEGKGWIRIGREGARSGETRAIRGMIREDVSIRGRVCGRERD